MAQPKTYPPGVTCWIDTEQPDPEAASRFYGALFGWALDDAVSGSCLVATLDGKDGSAATAERLGATIVSSSEDTWTRNALVRDPQGAEFTVSQFTPPDG